MLARSDGLLLLLLLLLEPASAPAVFTDRSSLKTAVNLWLSNQPQALSTYGDISAWDVSSVTDMSEMFNDATSFNDDISGAQCTAKVKLSDEANWQSVGEPWEFPIDKNASAASNPANWNALILDMPYGQWSVKGYGAPKVNMLDRYRNFVVSMRSGNATDKAIRCELMHYNRQKLAVHLKGPDTMFRDDVVDVPIELVNAGDKSIDGELILSINSQKHTLAKNWTLPVDGQWKKITR